MKEERLQDLHKDEIRVACPHGDRVFVEIHMEDSHYRPGMADVELTRDGAAVLIGMLSKALAYTPETPEE